MKGIGSFEVILGTVVGLYAYIAVYPTLDTAVTTIIAVSDPYTAAVWRFIPAIILVGISISLFAAIPRPANK
jgi:hypothetical protein